jgi:hypothetical protein
MALSKVRGIIDIPSNHSVDETVAKLMGFFKRMELPSSRWRTTAEKRKK